MKNSRRTLMLLGACVAGGQLISFINALINTVTSDAIHGALGG